MTRTAAILAVAIAALLTAGPVLADDPPPSDAPQLTAGQSAEHKSGRWTYRYTVANFGTRNERRAGVLLYDDEPITGSEFDRIETPWGMMQLLDGSHNAGWLAALAHGNSIKTSLGRLLPHPLAVQRAETLRKDINSFTLRLRNVGPSDKPYYHLLLTVARPEGKPAPFELVVPIEPEQANILIDRLTEIGLLYAAEANRPPIRMVTESAYVLEASGAGLTLTASLGWNLPMLARLDAIRGAMAETPGARMNTLRSRLDGLRTQCSDDIAGNGRLAVGMRLDHAARLLKRMRLHDITESVPDPRPGPFSGQPAMWYLFGDRTVLRLQYARWGESEPPVVTGITLGQRGAGFVDHAHWNRQSRTDPNTLDLNDLADHHKPVPPVHIAISAAGTYVVGDKSADDLEGLEAILCEIDHPATREVLLAPAADAEFEQINRVLKLLLKLDFRDISLDHSKDRER